MNKVYKSVWNASAGTYVAAAENVNASGRKSSRRARNLASAALASAATFGSIGFAHAADSGAAAPLAVTGLSSANPAAPLLASSVGAASSSSSVASAGVVVQDARASTAYESNNLKYFHVNSTLADSWVNGNDAISIGGGARANSTSTNGVIYVSDRASTGSGPVAIGAAAFAQGAGNVALGMNAQADGLYHAVALGGESQAHNPYALAAGGRSIAAAESSTALGGHAEAQAVQSVALGYESIATRANTVSVGKEGAERQLTNLAAGTVDTDAVNLKQMNTAVQSALASGNPNDAVRYDSSLHTAVTLGGAGAVQPVKLTNIAPGQLAANSKDAVNGSQLYATANSIAGALGGGSKVNSDGTVTAPALTISGTTYNDVASAMNAIGVATRDVQNTAKYVKVVSNAAEALSLGSETTAIGGGSFAAGSRSLALGAGARAQFDDSVAIGSGAQTYEANTVSVGHSGAEKRITNLAAGVNSTDAATVGQLNTLQQLLTKPAQNTVLKSSALLGANLAAAAAPVTDFIAVSVNTTPGPATHVSDANNAMAIGPTSAATGGNALAVGAGSGALRTGSTAVGAGTAGLAINATVVGLFATTGYDAQNGVAVGYMAASEGADTVTIGTYAVANADSSLSLGMRASTARGADNSVALGNGAKTSAAGAIALGANSVGDRANTVSVGNSTLQRQIVNVAAGTSKNDAVNVDQLKGVTASLGGGADVGADGAVKRPSYTVGGQTYTDVGSAINAAALSGAGAVDAVKYDTTAHDKVTLGGTGARAAVKLGNLAEGRADSDAVNVKQLKDLGAGIDTSGNVTSAFVAYDDSTKTRVTFGGKSSTTPVTLANVADGKANNDAVNVKQLKDLGAGIDTSGNVTSAFVAYDDSAKTRVTFGGKSSTTPVTLANVADGKANNDAVNVKQLKDLGASIDTSGNVTSAFVAYDDATRATVTLKGTDGTRITRVAAGTLSATSSDAVNGAQLYKTNQDVANVSGDVTNLTSVVNNITNGAGIKYFTAASTLDAAQATGSEAIAIGGNARATAANSVALGANATTTANLGASAYQPGALDLAGTTPVGEVSFGSVGSERRLTNVAAGAAGTDAVNVSQLKSAVAAGTAASLANAVQYDNTAHDSVTLGGGGALVPVALKNVAPGQLAAGSRDAVNGAQLFNTASSAAAALGGGAVAGSDGKIKAPTYTISDKTYNDVGSALAAVGHTVDTINHDVSSATKFISVRSDPFDANVAEALASGQGGVAIGSATYAYGDQSLALGPGARTSGFGSVALGAGAKASEEGGIALGTHAVSLFANSVAIGYNAEADQQNTVSVGNANEQRRITHVADGVTATDAATVGQLDALKNQLSKSGGGGLRSMALLAAPAATPVTDYIAVSTKVTAGTTGTHTSNDENAMAVGPMAAATGKNALAVGAGAGALRTESTAFGAGAAALSNGSTVVGNMASTGYDATASVAVGYMAAVEGDHTVALGMKATANGAYSLAVGANATTAWSAANSIALGGNSLADRANTISVGNASLQRQIVNVAAGSGNFDAVNVTQLNGVLGALGGKAGLDANGAVQKPAYQIGGNSYSDVGSALAAVAELGGSGAVDAVKYDTSAHDMLTLGGVGAAVPVALTNLAAGTVSATSRDAINGAQLYGTAHSIATALGGGAAVDADGKLGKPAYKIGENSYDSVGNAFSAVNSALASGGDPNAVVYDSTARDRVTLNAGNAAVTLSNVAAAKADSDAVNLGQLKAAGLAVDPGSGLVTNAFVAYDNTSKTSVTFNAGSSPTQLKNVADGVDQYDAVNVRQMQQYVTNQINHLPTPSPVVVNDLPTGTASGDAIAIGNGSVASGAAAIAIGARTVTAGDNSVALGVQASAPAQNAVALGANSVADRDNTVSVGSAGAERQITNVAAGTAPTDAVNLNQLNSAVSGLQKNLHDMDRDNRRGIAAASALNIVTPYLPGRTTLNAGVAGYRGTAALGLGVSRWNEKGTVNYNLGVSSAGGNSTIVRAGVGIVFGN